jgi:hypothetical protein
MAVSAFSEQSEAICFHCGAEHQKTDKVLHTRSLQVNAAALET